MATIDREKMDRKAAAKRFVENYYRTFEANRADLVNLYQEESVLFYDDQKVEGKEAIMAELISVPFHQHHVDTIHCLPDSDDGSVTLVHVTGGIRLEGEQNAVAFLQVFHLLPTPRGSFHVVSDFLLTKFSLPNAKRGHFVFKPSSQMIPVGRKF